MNSKLNNQLNITSRRFDTSKDIAGGGLGRCGKGGIKGDGTQQVSTSPDLQIHKYKIFSPDCQIRGQLTVALGATARGRAAARWLLDEASESE
jgi:hypothetical protein